MSGDSCLLIGRKPLLEALEQGDNLERIYLQNSVQDEFLQQVRNLARVRSIPLRLVPLARLQRFTRAKHQGVVALRSVVQYYSLQDLIDADLFRGAVPFFVVITELSDVRNIGAIARTAYASGVTAMILVGSKGSMALRPEVVKSSAGALLKIKIAREHSLTQVLQTLNLNGITSFFTSTKSRGDSTFAPYNADLKQPLALIIGGEAEGIKGKYSGIHLHIPMCGDFDSLNVSVATGILLYEVQRQRTKS